MTEPNDNNEWVGDNSNNLDLIYEYTESILKAVNEDIVTINTKIGTVIAFDSVLIRTAMDLPDQSQAWLTDKTFERLILP